MWDDTDERSVKPSAQPTFVRTQHLPPPAKTARTLRKRGPAGCFLLVTTCIGVCHCASMRSSGCVHMVYSERAERAVRKTARFGDLVAACRVEDVSSAPQPGGQGSAEAARWMQESAQRRPRVCSAGQLRMLMQDVRGAGLRPTARPRLERFACTSGTPFVYLSGQPRLAAARHRLSSSPAARSLQPAAARRNHRLDPERIAA